MPKYKVLAVADYPSPHLTGVFEALQSHKGLELKVFFTRQEDPSRAWGSCPGKYIHEFVPIPIFHFLGFNLKFGLPVWRRVLGENFELLLVFEGYFQPLTLFLLAYARLTGKIGALFSEPPYRRKRNFAVILGQKLFSRLLSNCIIFTPGIRGVEIFRKLAPKRAKIVNLPYFMNLESFALASEMRKLRPPENGINILYCGRFIRLKRLDLLLQALTTLSDYPWRLLMVGSGPEEGELRRSVPSFLADRVIFLGKAAFPDMPVFYALGDVFVYPSNDDGWGMAVPEALAAGLPVISTSEVSSAVDLITNGVNGFLIPADSLEPLREAILYFLAKPEAISRFSQNASRVSEIYNEKYLADRFYEAILNFPHGGS